MKISVLMFALEAHSCNYQIKLILIYVYINISSSTINALKGFAVSIAHSKRPLSNILSIKSDNNIEQKYHFNILKELSAHHALSTTIVDIIINSFEIFRLDLALSRDTVNEKQPKYVPKNMAKSFAFIFVH